VGAELFRLPDGAFVPLLGFKPDRTNEITVTVHDRYGNEFTASEPAVFITGPLPADFPTIVLLSSQPDRMEPGYTLFAGQENGAKVYLIIVDNSGEVSGMAPTRFRSTSGNCPMAIFSLS